MILIIDNYDSFVYNLAHYVQDLGQECHVIRNDAISPEALSQRFSPSHLIISPGPGTPFHAGISMAAIQYFYQDIPILGVCLGHQAIGAVFGAAVVRAKMPMHGKSSFIAHEHKGLFCNLPDPLCVGRYHSLIISSLNLPPILEIHARSVEGEIMALKHRMYPVYGVQFHPESILSEQGHALLANFMQAKPLQC